MKLIPTKVSSYWRQLKVRRMEQKIQQLDLLVHDLEREAVTDPERAVEYNDSIECVQGQVETITRELQIVSAKQ